MIEYDFTASLMGFLKQVHQRVYKRIPADAFEIPCFTQPIQTEVEMTI